MAKALNYVEGKHKYYGRLTPCVKATLNSKNV